MYDPDDEMPLVGNVNEASRYISATTHSKLLDVGHHVLQVLLLQTSCNHPAGPALPLRRLKRILIIFRSRYLGVPISMIRLPAITVKVGWCRQAITHSKVRLWATAGAKWAIEKRYT